MTTNTPTLAETLDRTHDDLSGLHSDLRSWLDELVVTYEACGMEPIRKLAEPRSPGLDEVAAAAAATGDPMWIAWVESNETWIVWRAELANDEALVNRTRRAIGRYDADVLLAENVELRQRIEVLLTALLNVQDVSDAAVATR